MRFRSGVPDWSSLTSTRATPGGVGCAGDGGGVGAGREEFDREGGRARGVGGEGDGADARKGGLESGGAAHGTGAEGGADGADEEFFRDVAPDDEADEEGGGAGADLGAVGDVDEAAGGVGGGIEGAVAAGEEKLEPGGARRRRGCVRRPGVRCRP